MDSDAKRALLLARDLRRAAAEATGGFAVPAPVSADLQLLYDLLIDDSELRHATETLFLNGHYASAVEEAYKFLNNLVKARAGHPRALSGKELDGADLMRTTFSRHDPLLRFSDLKTESKRNAQEGYMHLFEGVMIGVRNPRAHQHGYPDEARPALELLAMCAHLTRFARSAVRTRRRRQKARTTQRAS